MTLCAEPDCGRAADVYFESVAWCGEHYAQRVSIDLCAADGLVYDRDTGVYREMTDDERRRKKQRLMERIRGDKWHR